MSGLDEPHQTGESAEMPVTTPPNGPEMDELDRTVAAVAADLKHHPGVHGVGRGYGSPEQDAIVVFVNHEDVEEGIPQEVAGHPVIIQVVQGGFHAQ